MAAAAYAEADLSESERLRDRGEFKASAAVLQRAKERLDEFVPPELRTRLATAFDNLEFVTRLDAIRLERALVKPPTEVLGVLVRPATTVSQDGNTLPDETLGARHEIIRGITVAGDGNRLPDETPSGLHYEAAFREAGIGAPGDDPSEASARVRASPVSRALVAALDDWAACAVGRDQQAWILAVVRNADPDPWRNLVRDPATWDNSKALLDLAARAPVAEQSPQLLAVLGARLRAKNLDAVPFLARVAAAYPNDFWTNIETGNALLHQSKAAEATGYYRAALALRPGTVSLHYALGGMYLGLYRWDQCIAEYEQAICVDPGNAWCHNRLGVALQWRGGQEDEAIAQFRESIRIDPNIGWTHHHLAVSLEHKGRFDEAVEEFSEAAQLFPEKRAEWQRDLRRVLMKQGRRRWGAPPGRRSWRRDRPRTMTGTVTPSSACSWGTKPNIAAPVATYWRGSARPRTPTSPNGSVEHPCCVPAPRTSCARRPLSPTWPWTPKEAQYDWVRQYFHFAKELAHYRQGRFDDAIATMTGDASKAAEYLGPSPRLVTAMALYQNGQKDDARTLLAAAVLSNDWSKEKATGPEAWIAHVLRREAEALIVPIVNPIHPDSSSSLRGTTGTLESTQEEQDN